MWSRMTIRGPLLVAVALTGMLGTWADVSLAAESAEGAAREIIEATGAGGGIIVRLGCRDGRLIAELAKNPRLVLHGLDTDEANIAAARKMLRSQDLYGRASVDRFDGKRLPYAENLVNLIVAEDLGDVPMAEVMRVLCPRGVACIRKDGRWTTSIKPWPEEIDEWTHYLHGPDGNAVARDTVVGPPKHYQWIAGPLWLRSHESDASVKALVTARGRIFAIADEAPASLLGENPLPDKWFLTARDAFNGMPLWKVPIEDWGWRAWKPSWFTPRPGDIPLNVQKRLVAVDDRVYVTLGYRAPVSQLDAATGQVLQTYADTDRTAEILVHEGVLVLTILRDDRAVVMAVDTRSGKRLWASEKDYGGTTTDYYRFRAMHGSVTPAKVDPTLNTATDGHVIALLDGEDVVCLDYATGREKWRATFPLVTADYRAGNIDAGRTLWTGTLITLDGAVVHASPNQLAAFSAASGELLWKQPKKYLGHLWYEWKDVFVIDGTVWTWSAETKREKLQQSTQSSSWPVSVNGYDLQTGRLVKSVPLGNIFKTHHHHRCYRNKATSRYILASRRGTEFVDLQQGQHTVDNWVRGTCHLGMIPAGGLQYVPPHPCVCYDEEKLNGFQALAPAIPESQQSARPGEAHPLERGPAFGEVASPDAGAGDWPAFRRDALRSGSVKAEVPTAPRLLWQANTGEKLSAPVAVGDRLFVSTVDAHGVVALDATDGKQLWQYTAGGRIDSPPTYHRGTVLFGSADGWVYCVDAAAGQLVWRFRAAPEDRRIGAFGQLESAWPVHGSVLVIDSTAYFAAGRSSHTDGGIHLFGLDAASGELRCRTTLQGPSYRVDNIEQNYALPMGALPDILQADDTLIYMRHLVFDRQLQPRTLPRSRESLRIRARGGLLDESYFKRIPWSYTPKGGWARLIVHDHQTAYSVRMFDSLQGLDPKVYFVPGSEGYLLFAVDRATGKRAWERRIPVRINTMVAAENLLLVAGPPDVVDPDDPLGAFEGRKGGVLAVCNPDDGSTQWKTTLPSPPVFNGMAAAGGRFYVTMQDGTIACFGE